MPLDTQIPPKHASERPANAEWLADACIARAQLLEGFRDEPDCFIVSAYALNEDKWTDGFIRGYRL
jgi:hypothetical protein